MKVVFVMRHSGYVRNFESTLRQLCERGHRVHVAYQAATPRWMATSTDIAAEIAREFPNLSCGMAPVREDGWGMLGAHARQGLDYLRYLTPQYRDAPKLTRRAERGAPSIVRDLTRRGVPGRALLRGVLRQVDRATPHAAEIDAFFDEHRPDVFVVTPLVEPGSPQVDFVRAARARGIRTMFCVASWDNLTNKGLIHESVDRIAVWNEQMKREAVELHGVPPDRVVVTGAQPFDHWFEWVARRNRADFMAEVGLPADLPYLLYVCSSRFVAPDETGFIRRWIGALRAASGTLGDAGVLVRPHPQHTEQWQLEDLSDLGHVAIWPRSGAVPVDAVTRADYYDSIFHSAAVVGINTTAEIESAIVGRPVFTVLDPEFAETQEGTLHFQHLRDVNGGLLHIARTLDEHLDQLRAALQNRGAVDERCRRFVDAFVRPFGINEPATPRLVAAIEQLAAAPPPAAADTPVWLRLTRPLMRPVASRLRRQAVAAAAERARRDKIKTKQRAQRAQRQKAKAARMKPEKVPESTPAPQPEVPSDLPAPAAVDVPTSLGVAAVPQAIDRPDAPPAEPDPKVETPAQRRERLNARQARVAKLAQLVEDFTSLPEAERSRFVLTTHEHFPPSVYARLQPNTPDRLDYEPVEILLQVTSRSERRRLRACAKEPFTVQWIEQSVAAGEVLYDIGANVGAYSLVAAKKLSGPARVFAFEPSYSNLAALTQNVVLNGVSAYVKPLGIALSNVNGLGEFHMSELGPGSALHSLGGDPAAEPALYVQPVLTYRLDDLVRLLKLPPPNHIKLDVDGGELRVLEGAVEALASPELKTMLVEVSMDLSTAVSSFLEDKGLKLFSRVNVQAKSGEYLVWYGLFARSTEGLSPLVLPSHPALALAE
jgi:FkbM family methyltransferase